MGVVDNTKCEVAHFLVNEKRMKRASLAGDDFVYCGSPAVLLEQLRLIKRLEVS